MICIKKSTRDCFNIFKDYQCKKCLNYRENQTIHIGGSDIHLYYPIHTCSVEEITSEAICFNVKIISILYEFIKKDNNDVLLWWTKDNKMEEYFTLFNALFEEDIDIHIIVL